MPCAGEPIEVGRAGGLERRLAAQLGRGPIAQPVEDDQQHAQAHVAPASRAAAARAATSSGDLLQDTRHARRDERAPVLIRAHAASHLGRVDRLVGPGRQHLDGVPGGAQPVDLGLLPVREHAHEVHRAGRDVGRPALGRVDGEGDEDDPLEGDAGVAQGGANHALPVEEAEGVGLGAMAMVGAGLPRDLRGVGVGDADDQRAAALQGEAAVVPMSVVEGLEAPVDHAEARQGGGIGGRWDGGHARRPGQRDRAM